MLAAKAVGHEARSFDRVDGHDIMGDLSDLAWADAVIHLAGVLGTAELFDTPHEAIDINIHGTMNILEACAKYELSYTGITMPQVFPSVYTATKICATRLASAWHLAKGVPVSHVRAFNAYGLGQAHGAGHPQKIVPMFAVEAWAGRPLPIWGDGEQTVDLIHADDLGRLLINATQFGDDWICDGGTGEAMSVNEVAEIVLETTGSHSPIQHHRMRDGETPTHIVAAGEGWDRLDWKPEFDRNKFRDAIWSYRPQ